MQRRDILRAIGATAAFSATAATQGAAWAQSGTPGTLRVGVRGGVDEEIWEVVTQVAKKNG